MSDPVPVVPQPNYEVRLDVSKQADWQPAVAWCEANVSGAAGDVWSRRVDYGPQRDAAQALVFVFSDEATAAAFKIVFY